MDTILECIMLETRWGRRTQCLRWFSPNVINHLCSKTHHICKITSILLGTKDRRLTFFRLFFILILIIDPTEFISIDIILSYQGKFSLCCKDTRIFFCLLCVCVCVCACACTLSLRTIFHKPTKFQSSVRPWAPFHQSKLLQDTGCILFIIILWSMPAKCLALRCSKNCSFIEFVNEEIEIQRKKLLIWDLVTSEEKSQKQLLGFGILIYYDFLL